MKTNNRSTQKIACKALKGIASVFATARNSVHRAPDLVRSLVRICIQNASAELCSGPSSDTLLRRLHKVDGRDFAMKWRRINTGLLRKLALRQRVVMALDFTTLPYYGAVQPALVGDSRLPGTRFGVRFAMLSVVEDGRTFVLGVRQTTPFNSKVGIVKEMLGRAPIKPRMLLLDRGFYAVDVILAMKSMKTHFLMPAKRTAPVKRLCKSFRHGEIPPVVDYVVRSFGASAPVKLIFTRRKTKRGWETHAFVSDVAFEPHVASGLYRRRWRIETNYRELKKFMPRTTSRSMKLRQVYYSLAALLYNLWIVTRNVLGALRAHEFKRLVDVHLAFSSAVRVDDPPPPL